MWGDPEDRTSSRADHPRELRGPAVWERLDVRDLPFCVADWRPAPTISESGRDRSLSAIYFTRSSGQTLGTCRRAAACNPMYSPTTVWAPKAPEREWGGVTFCADGLGSSIGVVRQVRDLYICVTVLKRERVR